MAWWLQSTGRRPCRPGLNAPQTETPKQKCALFCDCGASGQAAGQRHKSAMGITAAASSTAALHKVFVYGSLMDDEVVNTLLKRVPSSSNAILPDHRRYRIKGRDYPAILPVQNEKVKGKVLFGITDSELEVLDIFEDEEYERRSVSVTTSDCLETFNAHAYVWANLMDPNLYGEWDFDIWKDMHKKKFLENAAAFMEDLEDLQTASRLKFLD